MSKKTLREIFMKIEKNNITDILNKTINIYNNIYHKAIKCSAVEALENYENYKLQRLNIIINNL